MVVVPLTAHLVCNQYWALVMAHAAIKRPKMQASHATQAKRLDKLRAAAVQVGGSLMDYREPSSRVRCDSRYRPLVSHRLHVCTRGCVDVECAGAVVVEVGVSFMRWRNSNVRPRPMTASSLSRESPIHIRGNVELPGEVMLATNRK
jgi:hypothetical protein